MAKLINIGFGNVVNSQKIVAVEMCIRDSFLTAVIGQNVVIRMVLPDGLGDRAADQTETDKTDCLHNIMSFPFLR